MRRFFSYPFIVALLCALLSSTSVFAQTPFKVVWKQGIITGLIVPSTTTEKQLSDFIYMIRKARIDKTISNIITPTTPGLPAEKYAMFIILIFKDPKWSTLKEYKQYENTLPESEIAKRYLNHVAASYVYELDGKEYGALGHDDGDLKSRHYRKLF